MDKSYTNHEQKLENELRKKSKQDSKTFKILNRFGKKGTDKNIKFTIDQLYEYFKSLNENDRTFYILVNNIIFTRCLTIVQIFDC
jgi:hypothetical protein